MWANRASLSDIANRNSCRVTSPRSVSISESGRWFDFEIFECMSACNTFSLAFAIRDAQGCHDGGRSGGEGEFLGPKW